MRLASVALVGGAALALCGGACTQFTPPVSGVAPDFAGAWGCNADSIRAMAQQLENLRKQMGSDMQFIPKVGWDACVLLAHNGIPTRIEYQQTTETHAASWWYQCVGESCDETHLVDLEEQADGGWLVTYVGW